VHPISTNPLRLSASVSRRDKNKTQDNICDSRFNLQFARKSKRLPLDEAGWVEQPKKAKSRIIGYCG
jgi:hypothetical protein